MMTTYIAVYFMVLLVDCLPNEHKFAMYFKVELDLLY